MQKEFDMHQSRERVLSTRAYENPCWHYKSTVFAIGACPKSFATMLDCSCRPAHETLKLSYAKSTGATATDQPAVRNLLAKELMEGVHAGLPMDHLRA